MPSPLVHAPDFTCDAVWLLQCCHHHTTPPSAQRQQHRVPRHCRYGRSACCWLVLLLQPPQQCKPVPIVCLPSDHFSAGSSSQTWLLPPLPLLPPLRPLPNPLPVALLAWRLLGLSSTLWGAAESVSARNRAACSTLPPPRPLPLASVLTRPGALATAHEHATSRLSLIISHGARVSLARQACKCIGSQRSYRDKAAAAGAMLSSGRYCCSVRL
jgi:hypothetical protein